MPCVCVVFAETRNSDSAIWPSRREATSVFVSAFSRWRKSRELVGRVFVCVPDTTDELPEMATSEAATRVLGVDTCIIECRKRGEAYGFKTALDMVDDPSAVVATLCYPGSVDWEGLYRAVGEFQADDALRVVSFRSNLDPEATRGLENIFVRACALQTITRSAMFDTMVGYEGDAWTDVVLAMCERLLVTEGEIRRVEWTKHEGILQCDCGDRVVFAEEVGENQQSLTVYRGTLTKILEKDQKAEITFTKADGNEGRETVGFDHFRVVRRYTPVCFLEDLYQTCYRLRESIGAETITQTDIFGGFRDILEGLNKARVLSLLSQVTADATENARAYFTNQKNMDPEVVDGVVALARIDGVRQTAALTGNVQDFPMENACARSWEGRLPLPLMVRLNSKSCEVVPLTRKRLLSTKNPWFSGVGARAARAFLLAYCGKARVSIEGL